MAKNDNLKDFLTDVADAIREKKGTTEKINPQDFSDEIRGIESGGGGKFAETMIDNNGTGKNVVANVVITEGVTTIANSAYAYMNISSISLPKTLLTIDGNAFYSCVKLKSIEIPDSVTSIQNRAFMGCSKLTNVNMPSGLTAFNGESFQTCAISVPIIAPSGVATIGTRAFYANSKIPYFDFRNHKFIPTLVADNAFASTGSAKFVVPDALYDQWIVATNWSVYASRIVKASEFVEPTNE